MKKFLSILLALAVGFTFTFGSAMSAFAATTEYDTYYAKVDAAAKQVKDQFEVSYTSAVNSYTASDFSDGASTPNTYNIGVDAFKAAAATYHEDVIEYIDDTTTFVKSQFDTYKDYGISGVAEDGNYLVALYTGEGTKVPANATAVTNTIKNAEGKTWDAGYKYVDAAARAQFDETKTDALKNIAALVTDYDASVRDITVYVDTNSDEDTIEFNAAYTNNLTLKTSYYDLAVAEQERLEKAVTAVTIGTKASLKEAADAAGNINNMTANIAEKTGSLTGEYEFKLATAATVTGIGSVQTDTIYLNGDAEKLVVLKTTATIDNETIGDKATKESVKGLLSSKSAEIYKAAVDAKTAGSISADEFANSEKVREALVTAYTFLIENDYDNVTPDNVKTYLNAITANTWVTSAKGLTGAYGDLVDNVANIKTLEEYAAKYKAAGYDAEAIDKIVDDAKTKAYKATISDSGLTVTNSFDDDALAAAKKSIEEANDTDLELEFNKAAYIAGLEDLKANVANEYYEKEAAELVALIDTHIPNIKAAADANAFAVAKNNYEVAAAKIYDIAAVQTSISGYVNKAMTTLDAYEALLNAGKKTTEKIDIDAINWNDFFAAKGARTQAEVDALIADAKAKIDTIKTAADLKTEKEAVEALVKAIPAVVKADSEAAIKAAWEANKAYVENNGENVTPIYNQAALEAAITALHNLNKAALSKEIAKLPAASAVKLTDKATIMAAYDKAVALNDATSEVGGMFEGENSFDMTTINGLYSAIRTLDKDAAIAKINAIPVEVKLADKATIEAARAACDEFIKEYTSYTAPTYDAASELAVAMKDLTAAEKKLAELEEANKFTDADAKAYVFDQTIKATSAKLSAKKVKVTANFDASKLVENGYTVEYKFYKSTKKSSGYKYTGVTKVEDAKTYTNTNAKKGKNYYKFKVVVKNADGTVILTTALKDCKYALRTIK